MSPLWHVIFYVLYLILLAIGLWYLFYYTGVPRWVWNYFVIAYILLLIAVIIKLFAIQRITTACDAYGNVIDQPQGGGLWAVLYFILQLSALILIIIGIVFVVRYSTIPSWVWIILGVAILVGIIGSAIGAATNGGAGVIIMVIGVVALILYVLGIIFLIINADAPWWVWLILGFAFLFSLMASGFESAYAWPGMNTCVKPDPCDPCAKPLVAPCDPCAKPGISNPTMGLPVVAPCDPCPRPDNRCRPAPGCPDRSVPVRPMNGATNGAMNGTSTRPMNVPATYSSTAYPSNLRVNRASLLPDNDLPEQYV